MAETNSHFRKVGGINPRRTAFDKSYDFKFTCDMGELIPVYSERMVPGDTIKFGNEIVVRMHPMVAPILHEISATVHYFFVPFRHLWDKWEKYHSGGKNGDDASVPPRWPVGHTDMELFSLWDYFGYPMYVAHGRPIPPAGSRNLPLDFKRRAYNFIYDEYYRDQDLQEPLNPDPDGDATQPPVAFGPNKNVLKRNWAKDYFTVARPFRQRGTSPAFPIAGSTSAVFADDGRVVSSNNINTWVNFPTVAGGALTGDGIGAAGGFAVTTKGSLNNNVVSFENASTFDVADLRVAVQIQKWMERNARGGVRYTEFLRLQYGRAPKDERIQRPEYIGGSKVPIIVSEVLQTSESSNTPQGTMCGHGVVAGGNYIDTYHSVEPGLIMGLLSIMPKTCYEDGIPFEDLIDNRYDEYFQTFAHLSERAVLNCEVFPQGGNPLQADGTPVVGGDLDIWGFNPRYDEYRTARDRVAAEFRSVVPTGNTSLSYWHLARYFTELPNLNEDFIRCDPDKRIFAVPSTKGFMVNIAHNVRFIRPMPPIGEPGQLDHY